MDNNLNTNIRSAENGKTISRWKRTGILMAGFGFGGLIWGLEAYRGTVGTDAAFVSPFSFILGAVAMGVFGGLAISSQFHHHTKEGNLLNIIISDVRNCIYNKKFWAILGFGTVGWVVGFWCILILSEWLFLVGSSTLPFLLGIIIIPLGLLGDLDQVINVNMEPNLFIGNFWLGFLLVGGLTSLVYSLLIKSQILKTVLCSAVGFAFVALAGPILGNLIGNLFNSLFIGYIITFIIIGAIFGLSVSVKSVSRYG